MKIRSLALVILGCLLVALGLDRVEAASRPLAHVPTGTGFFAVTNGVQAGAAAAVNLASTSQVTGTLPLANGGTGLSSVGAAGTTLVSNGASYAAAAPGEWITALDCDLTAESTRSYAAAGSWASTTVCGKSAYVEPYIFGAPTIGFVNGSGLVFQNGTNACEWGGQAGASTSRKTCGTLWIPLSELAIAGLNWTTQFRVWIYVSAQTTLSTGAAGANLVFGIDNNPGANPLSTTVINGWFGKLGFRGASGLSQPALTTRMYCGTVTNSVGLVNYTGQSSYDAAKLGTSVLETGRLGMNDAQMVYSANGYSGGWPSNMVPMMYAASNLWLNGNASNTCMFSNSLDTPAAIGNFAGVVIAYPTGSAAADTATVARLRVDYKL